MKRFAEGIREAANIYVRYVREPNDNEVRAEVEKLYLAAERRLYDQVPTPVEKLSPRAFRLLKHAGRTRPLSIAGTPRRVRRRPPACLNPMDKHDRTIARNATGPRAARGSVRDGQALPIWRALGSEPEAPFGQTVTGVGARIFGRRASASLPQERSRANVCHVAEDCLARCDWRKAPRTADPRRPVPFARTVRECLIRVGAGHADAIGVAQ